jgi:hypothetical protein
VTYELAVEATSVIESFGTSRRLTTRNDYLPLFWSAYGILGINNGTHALGLASLHFSCSNLRSNVASTYKTSQESQLFPAASSP